MPGLGSRDSGSPEALCLMMQGPRVAPGRGLVQVGEQGLSRLLTRVVCELDSDWLGCAQGFLSIQSLDGFLRLDPLVKADESHTPRDTWQGEGIGLRYSVPSRVTLPPWDTLALSTLSSWRSDLWPGPAGFWK